jgi:nitroreductase
VIGRTFDTVQRPAPNHTSPDVTMTTIPTAFGLSTEQVETLLTTAGRAPSLHNTQPWRFAVMPRLIELHADPERALPVIDPDSRELRIACGAALYNLRLALHGVGVRPTVTILPDPRRPDLMATIRDGGRKLATPEQQALLAAVPRRRTNRHPFSEVALTAAELDPLRRAAVEEGAWLHVVAEREERDALQDLAAEAHSLQMDDPAFRAELERWTAHGPGRDDGVPATAGGPLPAPRRRWVMRDFRGTDTSQDHPAREFEEEPAIAVLTGHVPGDSGDVQVGQALERILLTATVAGLAVSFLSQVVEVPRTREELRRIVGGTRPPQAVLRIGRGWPVAATPRRAVADLLCPGLAAAEG